MAKAFVPTHEICVDPDYTYAQKNKKKKRKKDIGELAPSMKVVYLFPSRFCMKIFFKASPGYIPIQTALAETYSSLVYHRTFRLVFVT